MKRLIAILMAALMLTGILTACSGTVGMNGRGAYGNVSNTPNGTVNGTNRSGYAGNGYGYAANGYQNGTYPNGYGYGNSGTGMTGGQ